MTAPFTELPNSQFVRLIVDGQKFTYGQKFPVHLESGLISSCIFIQLRKGLLMISHDSWHNTDVLCTFHLVQLVEFAIHGEVYRKILLLENCSVQDSQWAHSCFGVNVFNM